MRWKASTPTAASFCFEKNECLKLQDQLDPQKCIEGEQDATELGISFNVDDMSSYNHPQQKRLILYIILGEIRRV